MSAFTFSVTINHLRSMANWHSKYWKSMSGGYIWNVWRLFCTSDCLIWQGEDGSDGGGGGWQDVERGQGDDTGGPACRCGHWCKFRKSYEAKKLQTISWLSFNLHIWAGPLFLLSLNYTGLIVNPRPDVLACSDVICLFLLPSKGHDFRFLFCLFLAQQHYPWHCTWQMEKDLEKEEEEKGHEGDESDNGHHDHEDHDHHHSGHHKHKKHHKHHGHHGHHGHHDDGHDHEHHGHHEEEENKDSDQEKDDWNAHKP